ncbi:MAG: GldG family protein [Chloroflexi bacterium]|nr:GldG family protein [Chloroflexota bacterium]
MRVPALLDRLSSIFAVIGTIALLAALGTFLILGQLDRWVIVLAAVGIGLWVYALLERPERTAAILTSRGVRYGSNTAVMSVALIAILGLINVLANRYSDRFDLTANHLYTLAPLSVQVARDLKQPVKILYFYRSGDPSRDSLEDLLKEYTRYTRLISYEFVDVDLKPGLARQYNVTTTGTVVLDAGSKRQMVTGSDEGTITSALLKLERGRPEVVYYLTGHGELDFASTDQEGASTAKDALDADNYDLRPLNLAATGKVPSDASAVIVAGPTVALLPQEVSALESYIDGGGKALFLVDKRSQGILKSVAAHYGVEIGNGIVIDQAQFLLNDPLTPLISHYQFSPITKDLPALAFQAATSVTPVKTPPAGLDVQPIAQTTENSWLETDSRVAHYDPGIDPRGPLTVVASVTRTSDATASSGSKGAAGMRVVFIGDVAFATNGMIDVLGNRALLTNSVNWLTANEDLIQIEAKSPLDQTLTLSNTQLNVLLYGSAVFLPLVVLAAGVVVWWNRR